MTRSDRLARCIEPELSDARLARQYAVIAERAGRPRFRAPLSLILVPIAVTALVFFLVKPSYRPPSSAPAEIARIETARAGQLLTLADGSRIDVGASSALVLKDVRVDAVRLVVERGNVECDVTKNPARTFAIVAAGYEVRVVGTHFSVEIADDELRVAVSRGAVEIVKDGQATRRIAAGETFSAALSEPHASSAEPPKTEPEAALGGAEPAGSAERPEVVDNAARGESAKQLFERAMRARAAGRVSEARQAFQAFRARYPNDPRASLASFEIARLELDSRGDPKSASKLLDDAIRNAPNGSTLKEDAEARRVEALEKSGDTKGCRAAKKAFLASHPKSVHRSRVLAACPDS